MGHRRVYPPWAGLASARPRSAQQPSVPRRGLSSTTSGTELDRRPRGEQREGSRVPPGGGSAAERCDPQVRPNSDNRCLPVEFVRCDEILVWLDRVIKLVLSRSPDGRTPPTLDVKVLGSQALGSHERCANTSWRSLPTSSEPMETAWLSTKELADEVNRRGRYQSEMDLRLWRRAVHLRTRDSGSLSHLFERRGGDGSTQRDGRESAGAAIEPRRRPSRRQRCLGRRLPTRPALSGAPARGSRAR